MNERFRVTSNPKYLSVVFDERQKKHYVGTDLEDFLNEQDEKIKELETENEWLKKELMITKNFIIKDSNEWES